MLRRASQRSFPTLRSKRRISDEQRTLTNAPSKLDYILRATPYPTIDCLPHSGLVQYIYCDPDILRHDSDRLSKDATSGLGQSRRFGCGRLTSDSPPATDFARPARLVRFVPEAEVPSYSITSSAMARSKGGICRPSALAALRLMTSSNFVDCSTGRSAGFAPCRILSVYSAARLYIFEKFTP